MGDAVLKMCGGLWIIGCITISVSYQTFTYRQRFHTHQMTTAIRRTERTTTTMIKTSVVVDSPWLGLLGRSKGKGKNTLPHDTDKLRFLGEICWHYTQALICSKITYTVEPQDKQVPGDW